MARIRIWVVPREDTEEDEEDDLQEAGYVAVHVRQLHDGGVGRPDTAVASDTRRCEQ